MKLEDIKIKSYGMIGHWAMEKQYVSKYSGTFECEGLSLHNKTFSSEIITERITFYETGKSEQHFYLDEPNSLFFDTIQELIKHYENGIE